MAGVYGKRYAGHEDRLFAELTRRYGEEKVAALQRRFEEESMVAASATIQEGHAQVETCREHVVSSTAPMAVPTEISKQEPATSTPLHPVPLELSNQERQDLPSEKTDIQDTPTQKVAPRGRLGSFDGWDYNPSPIDESPTSAADQDAAVLRYPSGGTSQIVPDATSGRERGQADSQVTPRKRHSEKLLRSPQRVLPQHMRASRFSATGIMTLQTNNLPPPQLQHANTLDAVSDGTKASPTMCQSEPNNGLPPVQTDTVDAKSREQASLSGMADTAANTTSQIVEQVTLEGLLSELYKKHQPDKLRNARQVAKNFAGKERELIRLLKAKYGALSVKRLEANIHLLEAASAKHRVTKTPREARGWAATIATFGVLSFFAVLAIGGASLVALDSHVCSNTDIPDQPDNPACARLSGDLSELSLGSAVNVVGRSYPLECFCLEWDDRESRLLSGYSGANAANLAKMLPFSSTAVEKFLQDNHAHEYYAEYAKPIVEKSKGCVPYFQTALSDVSAGISKRFGLVQEKMVSSWEPSQPLERTARTGSNASAESMLTKVAQASKSLLVGLQDQHSVGEAEGEKELLPVATADDVVEKLRNDTTDSQLTPDSVTTEPTAVIEVEVRQEGDSVSYTESSEPQIAHSEDRSSVDGESLQSPTSDEAIQDSEPLTDELLPGTTSFEITEGETGSVAAEPALTTEDGVAEQATERVTVDAKVVDVIVDERVVAGEDARGHDSSSILDGIVTAESPSEQGEATDAAIVTAEAPSEQDLATVAAIDGMSQHSGGDGVLFVEEVGGNSAVEPSFEEPEASSSSQIAEVEVAAHPTTDGEAALDPRSETADVEGHEVVTQSDPEISESTTASPASTSTPTDSQSPLDVDSFLDDTDNDDDFEFSFGALDPWELLEKANEQAAATVSAAAHHYSAEH